MATLSRHIDTAPRPELLPLQPQGSVCEIREFVAPRLSAREREVLRTWLMHDSKNDVARALYLSLGTVNTHLTRIRCKYESVGRAAGTKTALAARALQDGIVTLDEL